MQGSLYARGQPLEPRGPELGTPRNGILGAPKVATKCLLYVQGHLHRGELGRLNHQQEWVGAGQTWVRELALPFSRHVSVGPW